MSDFIWHWKKGSKKIYTRDTTAAEQALKDGSFVMAVRMKPPM